MWIPQQLRSFCNKAVPETEVNAIEKDYDSIVVVLLSLQHACDSFCR